MYNGFMDERYRILERLALEGDPDALQAFRRLALQLDRISEPVIRSLAGYGCELAREILPRRLWPTSASDAFDILYHVIPHNAHTASVVRYRVLALAYERMVRRPANVRYTSGEMSVEDSLAILDTTSWEFQLKGREPLLVIQDAIGLINLMATEDYYDELCIRSARDYQNNQTAGTFGGFYPQDPLVIQHQGAKKDCNAVGNLITERGRNDSSIPQGLDRAIYSLADAVGPKLVGFEGKSNLDQLLHGVRYFLDGMNYSWSNRMHVEAIWSMYLI